MYYYIRGTLVFADPNFAVIDAGGVGYKLNISGNTLGKIAGVVGNDAKLLTYLSVKEDALELYGFADETELSVFKMLISVSGIGTKSALSILSLMSPERFAQAVAQGDAKYISKAQGIGAKTAARVVLELKDKIGKEFGSSPADDYDTSENVSGASNYSEAVSALITLGYSRAQAVQALKGSDPSLDIEMLIKNALAKLL